MSISSKIEHERVKSKEIKGSTREENSITSKPQEHEHHEGRAIITLSEYKYQDMIMEVVNILGEHRLPIAKQTRSWESQFSEQIEDYKPDENFSKPELTKYNAASGDPMFHIQEYDNQLYLHNDEYLKCKVFPTTLHDEVATWFYKLPSRSVTSWNDLCMKFIQRFTHN